MNQGNLEEAKRTFLTCADIPDENLKDPHAHKSSVTSCLYNLGKLLHEQGQQEVRTKRTFRSFLNRNDQNICCVAFHKDFMTIYHLTTYPECRTKLCI